MSAEENRNDVDPEVIHESRELALRRPSAPTTVNELASLEENRGKIIIEKRAEILEVLRSASIKLTAPRDWTLFKTIDGVITGFLDDAGCDRVKKLWGIQIDNLSPLVRIPAEGLASDGAFAYQITGDGSCNVTGEFVYEMEGIRYSNERYALEKDEGIQREVAVRKAARANLDGGIVRELTGMRSVPIEELDNAWKGSWKKSEQCNKGRGFGSKAERMGAEVQQSEIEPQFQPRCEDCKAVMKFIAAGKSQQGKPYDAFWACNNRDHKVTVKHTQALADAKRLREEAQRQPKREPGQDG